MVCNAARGIAASASRCSVRVPKCEVNIPGGRIGQLCKLVESDATVSVAHSLRKRVIDTAELSARVDNDKIIAQPVHFHEGNMCLARVHRPHIRPRRNIIQYPPHFP